MQDTEYCIVSTTEHHGGRGYLQLHYDLENVLVLIKEKWNCLRIILVIALCAVQNGQETRVHQHENIKFCGRNILIWMCYDASLCWN